MKTLCERANNGQLQSNLNKFIKKVAKPSFICLKCGRVANKKSSLCRPVSFDIQE